MTAYVPKQVLASIGTTNTLLYLPSGVTAMVRDIEIENTDSAAADFFLYLKDGSSLYMIDRNNGAVASGALWRPSGLDRFVLKDGQGLYGGPGVGYSSVSSVPVQINLVEFS